MSDILKKLTYLTDYNTENYYWSRHGNRINYSNLVCYHNRRHCSNLLLVPLRQQTTLQRLTIVPVRQHTTLQRPIIGSVATIDQTTTTCYWSRCHNSCIHFIYRCSFTILFALCCHQQEKYLYSLLYCHFIQHTQILRLGSYMCRFLTLLSTNELHAKH
jgi:hypothetical protein